MIALENVVFVSYNKCSVIMKRINLLWFNSVGSFPMVQYVREFNRFISGLYLLHTTLLPPPGSNGYCSCDGAELFATILEESYQPKRYR